MNKVFYSTKKNGFNRRGCLVIQKTMAMTNIKLECHFLIIALTQKLLPGFYLNVPVVVMKFFISHNFFRHPHFKLLSLSNLVCVQRDPALPYAVLLYLE
jgi:hypothetical protein